MTISLKPNGGDQVTVGGVVFAHHDVEKVVDDFYSRVAADPVLKVPFGSVRDWPEHMARMTHFWWTRLGGRPYLAVRYDPVSKHFLAGFNASLLLRWLDLFRGVLNEDLNTEQSALWAEIAEAMGRALTAKNEMYGRRPDAGAI